MMVLLTFGGIAAIFTRAFLRLWRNPPAINLTVSIPELKASLNIPDNLTIRTQMVPADIEGKAPDEPIPAEILEYISHESEAHAIASRKRRVRELWDDTKDWARAYRLLQFEDNPRGE